MAASSRRARRGVGAGTSVATGGLSEAAATNDVDVGIDRSAGRSGGARHDPPARRRRGASRSPTIPLSQKNVTSLLHSGSKFNSARKKCKWLF